MPRVEPGLAAGAARTMSPQRCQAIPIAMCLLRLRSRTGTTMYRPNRQGHPPPYMVLELNLNSEGKFSVFNKICQLGIQDFSESLGIGRGGGGWWMMRGKLAVGWYLSLGYQCSHFRVFRLHTTSKNAFINTLKQWDIHKLVKLN